jgi:hypothetical protein
MPRKNNNKKVEEKGEEKIVYDDEAGLTLTTLLVKNRNDAKCSTKIVGSIVSAATDKVYAKAAMMVVEIKGHKHIFPAIKITSTDYNAASGEQMKSDINAVREMLKQDIPKHNDIPASSYTIY